MRLAFVLAMLASACSLDPTGELLGGGPDANPTDRDAASLDAGADGTIPRDATTRDGTAHDVTIVDGGHSKDTTAPDSNGKCTADCPNGDHCTTPTQCASGVCGDGGVCAYATSCNDLLAAGVTTDGAYTIQPAGASSSFQVYCDMTDEAGGWTLVLKMGTVSSPGTFEYSAAYWTNSALLNPTSLDMTQTEAKFESYNTVPFTSILGMMQALASTSTPNMLQIPFADSTSLNHLISSTATNTLTSTIASSTWTALTVPVATIQANCNMGGINIVPGAGTCIGPDGVSIRIGFIANDQDDCCSPNSYVGFGGENDGDPDCTPVSLSAGSMEGVESEDIACFGGTANIQDFGFIFVR
jgi:hypothetical protein